MPASEPDPAVSRLAEILSDLGAALGAAQAAPHDAALLGGALLLVRLEREHEKLLPVSLALLLHGLSKAVMGGEA